MKTLEIISGKFPLNWINWDDLPASNSNRIEIYLKGGSDDLNDLIHLFYSFFGEIKDDILIYDKSWWDFTLDTWNIHEDTYNYGLKDKHPESQKYLKMLMDSTLEIGYEGSCICNDWDRFLNAIIPCVLTHVAPYSHYLYSTKYQLFFYFHHTGSIGLYYREENEVIKRILEIASKEYDIRY